MMMDIPSPQKQRIHFTGLIEESDMAAVYSDAEVFIFPSVSEGFGLPPLEAMACGTPVIVSDLTSLPEVVGEAGLKFDPKRPDALLGAMEHFFANPGVKLRMRQLGIARAKELNWSNSAQQLASVYREVIQRHRSEALRS